MPLFRFFDHHVPYIVLGNIIVIDHHDISDHFILRVDPERLALIPVNIGLRQAPYGVGNELPLSRCETEIKSVKKVFFCNCSKFYHLFPRKSYSACFFDIDTAHSQWQVRENISTGCSLSTV